jgi:hypothetical protein
MHCEILPPLRTAPTDRLQAQNKQRGARSDPISQQSYPKEATIFGEGKSSLLSGGRILKMEKYFSV